MDLFELLWDTSQQIQINQNLADIQSNANSLQSAHQSIRELRAQALRITGTCQVLCELLTQKLGIDETELSNLIKEKLSLEATVASGMCPACGHRFHEGRSNCMYCGYLPSAQRP